MYFPFGYLVETILQTVVIYPLITLLSTSHGKRIVAQVSIVVHGI